jgi:hypothetical protein
MWAVLGTVIARSVIRWKATTSTSSQRANGCVALAVERRVGSKLGSIMLV